MNDFFDFLIAKYFVLPQSLLKYRNFKGMLFFIRYFSNYSILHRNASAARAAYLDPRLNLSYLKRDKLFRQWWKLAYPKLDEVLLLVTNRIVNNYIADFTTH